jgi:hypothetical protein
MDSRGATSGGFGTVLIQATGAGPSAPASVVSSSVGALGKSLQLANATAATTLAT